MDINIEIKKIIEENISVIEELFEDIDFFTKFVKFNVVQRFYTKIFCKDFNICENSDNFDYLKETTRINTNKKLINFFQTIYHAGTIKQFKLYSLIQDDKNLIMDTFYYMFNVLKKGVYVEIKNGNIKVFLPFSNSQYTNDWGQYLKTTNGVSAVEIEQHKDNLWKQKNVPEKYQTTVQPDQNKWYANYNFFRNTMYKNGDLKNLDDEGDKSITNFLTLLTELCYSRIIKDVKFFINARDYPIVKKNLTHPYERLYKLAPDGVPYLGEQYPIDMSRIPIFSQSISSEHADILMPNDDDIVNILCEKKESYLTNWSKKIDKAVFRGAATGSGVTSSTNPRLNLIEISLKNPVIDAKLISLNEKIKINEEGYIEIIDKKKYKSSKDYHLSAKDQAKFKYIIHVEGHVAAFRLTRELSYSSLIIIVESKWKNWYFDKLVGYRPFDDELGGDRNAHYIIVKSDMSDLISVIEWCRKNDKTCERIAERGYKFWKTHLSNKEYMFNYLQEKFSKYSDTQK